MLRNKLSSNRQGDLCGCILTKRQFGVFEYNKSEWHSNKTSVKEEDVVKFSVVITHLFEDGESCKGEQEVPGYTADTHCG